MQLNQIALSNCLLENQNNKKGMGESKTEFCFTLDQFHQHFTQSFYSPKSQKRKNSLKLSVSLYAFGI